MNIALAVVLALASAKEQSACESGPSTNRVNDGRACKVTEAINEPTQ